MQLMLKRWRNILPLRGTRRFHTRGAPAQVAIRAVPHRQEFYARLTQGGSHERFDSELAKWLAGLGGIVDRLKAFLAEGAYGTV